MNSINMHVFQDADEATGYGFNYNEWDKHPERITATDAVIVLNGTVRGLPTIDLVCVDEHGNKHVMLITGRLLQVVVDVAFQVQKGGAQ